jgi:NAD(P)H dehydrogenase (quinone)
MSKYLIIFANPSHEGHGGYLLSEITNKLKNEQKDYEIIDLYALNYNPVLKKEELYSAGNKEISEENLNFQKKIQAADRLIFIYPIWWQNMPAILKGFLDRIITGGFGFKYVLGVPVGLLKGKKAAIFASCAGPVFYTRFFIANSAINVLEKHILHFCGIKTRSFLFGGARKLEKNKDRLAKTAINILHYLR